MEAIHFVERIELDEAKWNAAIDQAPNGLIYGYTTYLDIMTPGWSALIEGDYLRIMPLPSKRKYGIAYIYQPFLVAQLGIFGEDITSEVMHTFLCAIPPKFKYWDINFNHQNIVKGSKEPFFIRTNYTLSLDKPYHELRAAYRDNIVRNIKKCEKTGAVLEKNIAVNEIIEIFHQFGPADRTDRSEDLIRFNKLYEELFKQRKAITYAIRSLKGDTLASAVFFYSHNRAYYIFVGNHPNGKTIGASHALIDAFIKDHADQSLILDFEGSDIKNLAFFYSSFGAVEEQFPALKANKLPFYLKWLKE